MFDVGKKKYPGKKLSELVEMQSLVAKFNCRIRKIWSRKAGKFCKLCIASGNWQLL